MLRAKGLLATLTAIVPVLVLHCGGDSSEDGGGSKPQAGEGGKSSGGTSGKGGTTATGGRAGASDTGGTAGRGGTTGKGGQSGDSGAPQGGQGDTGGSGGSGGSNAGAGGDDGGVAGQGGEAGDGGQGGAPTCEDPPGTGLCTGDLGAVGLRDFEVKFTITTSTEDAVNAVIHQRAICNYSYFWDARLSDGKLFFEVDDNGAHYGSCQSPVPLNDGAPHRVVVRRIAESLSIVVDCGVATSCPSHADVSMPLPPLGNQTNNPCIGSVDQTKALVGTVANVCVRRL
jgi:hypothetical protein